MVTAVPTRGWIIVGLISISILLVFCSVVPELGGESPEWVKSISSLCIVVQQSYPTVASGFSQPIGEELQAIFERMGVKTSLDERADCQATLAIQLEITPIAENVIGEGNCYLDAEATGKAELSSQGKNALEMDLEVKPPKNQGVEVIYSCPKTPGKAPVGRAWASALGDILSEWWGTPGLVSMLESEQSIVRWSGVSRLRQFGPAAAEAIPSLIEMLEDDQPGTRQAAAEALGEFGEAATGAVPSLVKAIDDSDPNARDSAIQALGQIGGDQARQALVQTLQRDQATLRFQAAGALGLMGSAAAPAIPDLIKAIEDEDIQVGWKAIEALGAIGPAAKPAIPKLIDMLGAEEYSTHYNAWRALINISGQSFGEDPNAWQQWWQAQP